MKCHGWCLYIPLWVCVCDSQVCTCGCVGGFFCSACKCMWKSEDDVGCRPWWLSTLNVEARSFTSQNLPIQDIWLALGISPPSSELWDCRPAATSGKLMQVLGIWMLPVQTLACIALTLISVTDLYPCHMGTKSFRQKYNSVIYPQRGELGMMESQAPQQCCEEASMHCWLIMEQACIAGSSWSRHALLTHHGTGMSKCGHFMVPVVSEQPDGTLESNLKWSAYRKIQELNVTFS